MEIDLFDILTLMTVVYCIRLKMRIDFLSRNISRLLSKAGESMFHLVVKKLNSDINIALDVRDKAIKEYIDETGQKVSTPDT